MSKSKPKEENRCSNCGCFMQYEDNSYLSEGGWTENEGFVCNNPRCKRNEEEKNEHTD